MNNNELGKFINSATADKELKVVAEKVLNHQRITNGDGILLYEKGDPGWLGMLADFIRTKKHGAKAFFNRNFHIEPTNICVFNCRFCSYRRSPGEPGSWYLDMDKIMEIAGGYADKLVTEVHITGGVHPLHDIHYYGNMIRKIKEVLPGIHVKAFSAIELNYIIDKAGMTVDEGLALLKEYGLDSIPGGGAEIFANDIREIVCDEKSTATSWLNLHEVAHLLGIPSNATMLYGHIENYPHRIDHLEKLRSLQDKTHGFNAFIPLKYKSKNNRMSQKEETSCVEDMKNFAVSRIFLDNIAHIKAYWPMIGKDMAQLSLSFGVDDFDGTIFDSTKIYSMAGAGDTNPSMNVDEVVTLIKKARRIPVERDSLYREINIFDS
jgi:aminodeoxyfutalosine synthase